MSRGMLAAGFTGAAAGRVAWAAAYALIACVAVRLVERAPVPALAAASAAVAAPTTTVELTIESTYPVSVWTVQRGGAALTARSSDARHWRGAFACAAASAEVYVQADNQDAVADGLCALRVEARRAGASTAPALTQTLVGDGLVSGSVTIALTAAAP